MTCIARRLDRDVSQVCAFGKHAISLKIGQNGRDLGFEILIECHCVGHTSVRLAELARIARIQVMKARFA